jgi:hypothetical protein
VRFRVGVGQSDEPRSLRPLTVRAIATFYDQTHSESLLGQVVGFRKRAGLDRHVWLEVGDTPPLLATFDDAQMDGGRASSVQYVRFVLSEEQQLLLATDGAVVRLRVEHPAYFAQAVLSEDARAALATDSR